VTRRQVALWNAVFGYSTLGVTLARNILLVPLYLAYIPLGEYGAWLATGGALVQLLIADFGLSGVVMQKVAACAGSGEMSRLRATIVAGLVNSALLAVGLALLGGLLAPFLPATQGLGDAQISRVVICFLIALASNAFGIVALAAAAAVRGLQKPVAAGATTLVADLLSIAATLAGLAAGLGLYALALAMLLRSVVAAGGGLGVLAWTAHGSDAPRTPFEWRDSLALWRDAGKFFVTSIAMRLQMQTNTFVVAAVLGPSIAAVYALTVRAHETVNVVLLQFNAALCPVLAHLAGAGQRERLDSLIRSLLPLVAAIAALGAAGVVALNESFVTLWVGAHGFGGTAVTVLMAVALWIGALGAVAYEALLARGEFARIARAYALASGVHILLLVVLVRFGPWAAPLSLCVSGLVLAAGLWRRVLADMGHSFVEGLKLGRDPLAIGAIAALAALCGYTFLPRATSWLALLGEGALFAALLGGVLLALRPTLRRLLLAEFATTLRALRAA
jgi:O-antigen/teichoic acid export membrane protein